MPQRQFRQNIPLLFPLGALVTGIIFGFYFESHFWSIFFLAAAVCAFAILRLYYYSLLAIIATVGVITATTSRHQLNPELENNEATYSGIILQKYENERTTGAIIAIDSVSDISGAMHRINSFRANIFFFDSYHWLSPGQRVRFTTKLSAPIYDPDLPDDPDFTSFYRYKEISATGIVFSNKVIHLASGSAWRIASDSIRRNISDKLYSGGISYECASFLNAILIGDDSFLDRELRNNFNLSGLSHIIALSGTHVAIIAILISVVLFPLQLLGFRNIALWLSILALFAYAIITGLSASVVRSVIMASSVIIAILSNRSRNSLNALCFAAIMILCVKPSELFSPGMQMSFSAVAAIIILANAINPISQRHRLLYSLFSVFTVIISAVAGTWIIACYYFHYTPLWFLPANIPLMLLMPIEIGGGILLVISDFLGLKFPLLISILDWVYSTITWIASTIASLPNAGIRNMFINPWCIPVYFIGLFIFSETLKSRHKHMYALSLGFFIATWGISVIPYKNSVERNQWYITRDNSWTDVVIYTGNEIFIATSAWRESTNETVDRFCSAHAQFMSHRNVDKPKLISDRPLSKKRYRQIISLDGTEVTLAGAPEDTLIFAPIAHSEYTIITRNSQSLSARQIRLHYNPDTIILTNEMYPSHHDRLADELIAERLPFISLRSSGIFSRHLNRLKSENR